ncbi:DNA starvation/stationary phase protection protein [Paenibacillus oralis]|uniref:DNA starvation/stationary phase protection protein n=1 Tax=Paenibacillus oralis TaxID=2490856 RepID=A0A3P3U304_9BACL|nr:DNA starvation/stationary phase protection protein [Paenibacillus oralis]RRJ64520.1 DNA starvation/stationary phase protection protein [Paenibacillus oralis]
MTQSDAKQAGQSNKTVLEQLLNVQVANLNVLYVKLHHFHWYVQGGSFFTLHAKFEQLYNEAAEQMDAIAERMLALKWEPAATLKEYLELSSIQDAAGQAEPQAMVQSLIEDLATLAESYHEAIDLADQAGDDVTGDLLTGYKRDWEKHMWMLRSYLG